MWHSKETLSGHSVLIVEDEAVSRRALSALLILSGHDTQAVRTAEEALDLVSSGNVPEFALVDLDLPGMNGMDLIHRLKRDHPDVIPVLITATSRERIERLTGDQDVQYMRKPIDLRLLLDLLDRGGREN
ncbi:MAG TPA: response regulator [Tepidisphaeraceae bacterium]|nr:response regulator [Tepidisphaeraceae bacterium]